MTAIVSLNAGSSSLKFALFALGEATEPTLNARGQIERIGIAPRMTVRAADGETLEDHDCAGGETLTHEDLLQDILAWTAGRLGGQSVGAIGHRVVHGGVDFTTPRQVDEGLLQALEALCPLAPLHQPHNLAAIHAIRRIDPAMPQVACFDTAFHHAMPPVATRLAIPRVLHDQGVRRYGFHGLSYAYVARRLGETDRALAKGRVIVAHLGAGASLCAMREGVSIDTTMGFTALDGLMMGTRCGGLDPGVVLHLLAQRGMAPKDVEDLLYRQSGLLGVSGISSDMRVLAQSATAEAEDAIDLFCWRAAREIGGLMSSLGGLDALVFTAGIGENDAAVRARICERLGWAGVKLEDAENVRSAARISRPESRVAVLVVPTDEERMIALQTLELLGKI
jgi:acetate kinase